MLGASRRPPAAKGFRRKDVNPLLNAHANERQSRIAANFRIRMILARPISRGNNGEGNRGLSHGPQRLSPPPSRPRSGQLLRTSPVVPQGPIELCGVIVRRRVSSLNDDLHFHPLPKKRREGRREGETTLLETTVVLHHGGGDVQGELSLAQSKALTPEVTLGLMRSLYRTNRKGRV